LSLITVEEKFNPIYCQKAGLDTNNLDSLYKYYFDEFSKNYIEYNPYTEAIWEEGYIITNNYDSIAGKIKKNRTFGPLIKIRFIPDDLDKKLRYTAYDLASFRKGNFSYYSKELDGYMTFVRYIETGKVDLIETDFSFSVRPKPLFYLQKTDNIVLVKRRSFKKIARTFFADYPKLINKIDKKVFVFEDLRIINKIYNERSR